MMPSLRLAAPFARFRPAAIAPRRRVPFPALALAVCLLFAAAGAAVLDDYGVGIDEPTQRSIAIANADYIRGDRDGRIKDSDWFYGLAFELPLLLVERLLGLDDSRDIYLSRHLLTHLFFIAGGFCCGLLAWRMFDNRWIALLALLLFLLHPRLYAHSFFNSKDLPFAVVFIIALYLTHRAFRRDTAGAFVLLGVVVGLAANMRPFALLLLPAVLVMRGLDWRPASGIRRRILLTAGSFAAAALLAIYASQPFYWENPLRFIDGIQTLSRHPTLVDNLFQGQIVWSDAVPADYIPVWFGITAPPGTLLLGAAGILAVLWRGWQTPGRILRKGELRFLFLTLGCFILPVAAVIVLQSHIYNGWRQMYFLWGPFCLLAAAGMHYIWKTGRGKRGRGKRGLSLTLRIAGCGLAAAGLGGALYAMVSLHPHQQIYFNLLAHRSAPGELGRQYDTDYWLIGARQGLEYLLERYPGQRLYVYGGNWNWPENNMLLLPAAERERIVVSDVWTADFYIGTDRNARTLAIPPEPAVYARRAYGSAYLRVTAPRLVWGAGAQPGAEVYRAAYQSLTAAASPAARSEFDVYIHDGALYYTKENCRPEDAAPPFFLHFYPVNPADLPDYRREYGFDNRSFNFAWSGGFFDGKCITREPLPDYPVARISAGQHSEGETLWRAEINPSVLVRFQEIEDGLAGLRPVAAAVGVELYRYGGMLVYRWETCAAAEVAARFYLHLFPADAADLPDGRQSHGFVNRGFSFPEYGAMRDGKCLAAAPLPDYPIARIRTGQHIPGRGQLWQADFPARPADAGR